MPYLPKKKKISVGHVLCSGEVGSRVFGSCQGQIIVGADVVVISGSLHHPTHKVEPRLDFPIVLFVSAGQ